MSSELNDSDDGRGSGVSLQADLAKEDNDRPEKTQADVITDLHRMRSQAMDFAKVGLYLYKINGEIVFIDKAALALLDLGQWDPASVIGRDISTLYHPIEKPGSLRNETLRQGEIRNYEFHYKTLSGEERWVYHNSYLIKEPKTDEILVQVISQDITDLKKSAIALAASERRFRTVAEDTPQGIAIVSGDPPHIEFANQALADIFGTTIEELLNLTAENFWQFAHPDDLELILTNRQNRLSGKPSFRELDVRIVRKDGEIRYVYIKGFETEFDGKPAYQASIVDVTQLRLEEARRRDSETQLLHHQKLESLGVLAGGIAHDFNNILAAITGGCDLAMLKTNDPVAVKNHLLNISAASERAAEMCHSLLTYAGQNHLELKPINLNLIIAETIPLLMITKSKKIELLTELSQGNALVLGDTSQLGQILLNLITNASEAIDQHSGQIRISTAIQNLTKADLATLQFGDRLAAGHFVCLAVEDNGCGMKLKTLERIFDPFFTTKFAGRGLGLASVIGIVKSHGGALKVDSTPNVGTVFSIYLPVFEGQLKHTALISTRPIQSWAKGRVLLAEDEPSVLETTKSMLQVFGFEVSTAINGVDALELVRERGDQFVAALLDLTMPHLGGKDVYNKLRKKYPTLPVLLMSGYTSEHLGKSGSEDPKLAFLQKPYRLSELSLSLQNLLKDKSP